MAEAQPLKYEELAEVGAFEKFIGNIGVSEEKVKSLEAAVISLKKELGTNARKSAKDLTGMDEKSIDTIRKLEKEIDRYRKGEKALTEAEKLLAYQKEKNLQLDRKRAEYTRADVAVQNAARGSVAEMRAELKKVTLEWLNLSEAEGKNAEQFKQLSARKLELTQKLKELEEATGDHRRSVGEYQKGLKGLTAVLIEAGKAFGLDTEMIDELKESHKELFKIGKEVKEVINSLGIGHKQEAKAVAEEAAAEVAANQVKAASIPIIGWVAAGIAALTAIVWAYIEASKAAKLEEMERSRAADGTIILNKELRDVYNQNIIAIRETALAYDLLRGKITQFEADAERLKTETLVKLSDAMNEGTEKAQEAGKKGFKEYAADYLRYVAVPFTLGASLLFKSGDEMANEARQKQLAENQKYYDELLKQAVEHAKQLKAQKLEEELQNNYNVSMKLLEQQKQLDEIHGEERIKVFKAYLYRMRDLAIAEAKRRNKDISAAELKSIRQEYDIQIEELKRRDSEEGVRRMEAARKLQEEIKKAQDENLKKAQEEEKKRLEELKKLQEQAAKDEVIILEVKAARAERLHHDSYVERVKAARAEMDRVLNDENASNAEKLKAIEDFEQKKTDIVREYEQKRVNEMVAFQEQIAKYFDQAFSRRMETQKAALQYETQLIDAEIQQQIALAQQGQENILGETIKAKAESLAKQKELDRKAQREKEFLQLAEIYFEYEKSFIAQGAQSASAKALIKTLEAKGIGEGLAAAFAEEGGILGDDLATDYKLFSKKHKTGQEVVVQAQPGEGFVSLKDMEGLKNGIIPNWMKKIYNPRYDAGIGMPLFGHQEISELKETLVEFKRAIEDRPQINFSRDLLGNLVISEQANGIEKRTIKTHAPIVPREKWND